MIFMTIDSAAMIAEAKEEPGGSPTVTSPSLRMTTEETRDKESFMADGEMTYHNGYHYVRDNDNGHEDVLLGQLISSNGDAARDASDSNRDLISAVGDASRDLINATSNGTQHSDLMGAVVGNREVTRDAQAHIVSDVADGFRDTAQDVGGAHRDILRESAAIREEVAQQGKENIIGILDQGSRGRETTLAQAAEIRNDIADAHSQNLVAHCETQKLVIKEHCETREAVREEGVRTRDLIVTESRALLERELAAKSEENTLLKLQLNLLSSGTGPLAAR